MTETNTLLSVITHCTKANVFYMIKVTSPTLKGNLEFCLLDLGIWVILSKQQKVHLHPNELQLNLEHFCADLPVPEQRFQQICAYKPNVYLVRKNNA